MSEDRLLGGRRALLGFFYQLMGSAGIVVLQATLRDPPLAGELSAVVSFAANQRCEFRLEEAGQDLTILAGEQRLLLQFKYAEEPSTSEIGLPETREILRSFAYSLIDLKGQGVGPERITQCVLVTNRSPGTALEQLLSRGLECRARLGVLPESWERLPADTLPYEALPSQFRIPGKRRHEGTLREWVEQEIVAGTPESAPQSQKGRRKRPDDSSDKQRLTEAVLWVLPRCVALTEISPRTLEIPFERFCQEVELRSSIVEPADPMVVDSLAHPRMLGAFAAVRREEPGVAEAALDAEPQALARVARHYLRQFFFKYGRRSEEGHRPRSLDCAEIFRRLAQLSLPIEEKLTLNLHWHPCAAHEGATRLIARQLFDEAESGGLIQVWRGVSGDREWAWRHRFVAGYLAATDPEEYVR